MRQQPSVHLELPDQTLLRHSLFATSAQGVQQWLASLPLANSEEACRQLRIALGELNRLKCSPQLRFALLEKLRPVVHEVKRGLHRLYLNKPASLPDDGRRAVETCHMLNHQLAVGYTLAAVQLADARLALLRRSETATAIHRALTEYARILLRQFQLYSGAGPNFWHTVHQLYVLARQHRLLDKNVHDSLFGDSHLLQAYLRPLLMATIPPNQLSQHELSTVFHYLNDWTGQLQLHGDELSDCVFLWSPDDDLPPRYRELCDDNCSLGIDTSPLRAHLEVLERVAGDSKTALIDEPDLHRDLIRHLRQVWVSMPERRHPRRSRRDSATLSVGLYATHYYVAGSVAFSAFSKTSDVVQELRHNRELSRKVSDVWSQSGSRDSVDKDNRRAHAADELAVEVIDYTSTLEQMREKHADQGHHSYEAPLINASAGGYCLSLTSSTELRLQAGDVVGVLESNSDHWQLGILRWVQHIEHSRSELGVERLSAAAEAHGARLVQLGLAIGHSYRVFTLPAEGLSPPRLLAQRGAFKAEQILELLQPSGQILHVKLGDCLMSTHSVNLFGFSISSERRTVDN